VKNCRLVKTVVTTTTISISIIITTTTTGTIIIVTVTLPSSISCAYMIFLSEFRWQRLHIARQQRQHLRCQGGRILQWLGQHYIENFTQATKTNLVCRSACQSLCRGPART
jgi:hypothetical protein